MAADDARARYLADRVMTASPAQRVVMLYDRLSLDIARAKAAYAEEDVITACTNTSHALRIVSELRGSLDVTMWDGAENLAGIYAFLMNDLIDAGRPAGRHKLDAIAKVVTDLREGWNAAMEAAASEQTTQPKARLAGGRVA